MYIGEHDLRTRHLKIDKVENKTVKSEDNGEENNLKISKDKLKTKLESRLLSLCDQILKQAEQLRYSITLPSPRTKRVTQ